MSACGPTKTLPPMKQGDAFSVGGTFTGMAADTNVTANINDPMNNNALVASLTVTLGPWVDLVTPRTLLLEADASDTVDWTIGDLRADLRLAETSGGFVIHSRTFIQPVLRAETPAPPSP